MTKWTQEEAKATADLFAAAPELYEALEAAKRELDLFKEDAVCDHSVNICWCGYWNAVEAADAALAKARGEAS